MEAPVPAPSPLNQSRGDLCPFLFLRCPESAILGIPHGVDGLFHGEELPVAAAVALLASQLDLPCVEGRQALLHSLLVGRILFKEVDGKGETGARGH